MLILALDTATPTVVAGVVAQVRGSWEIRAQRSVPAARRQAEVLGAVLAELGVAAHDLDGVIVGVGPGPFTGLRVGVVAAAAYAHARAVPSYGVCSLDALVPIVANGQPPGPVARVAVTDARRREVYWCAYDVAGQRVRGPSVDRPADLAAAPWLTDTVEFVGDPALGDVLGRPVVAAEPAIDVLVARAGLSDDPAAWPEPVPLVPDYLRRPDAVPPGARKSAAAR